ncbi:MAG TPA: hypothetical protein VMD03_03300 [Steroidobacteraceae bacterium]|nr:hypothetical protein [Steroidobacteraceae bacterium]
MRLIESTIRRCAPGLGVGRRWLKDLLAELEVRVHLCEGCLQDLANDAEAEVGRRLSIAADSQSYLRCLREELAARAEFVRRWTSSDERIDASDDTLHALVRIARNYALPRPWRLSEPVATAAVRQPPSYYRWASRTSLHL